MYNKRWFATLKRKVGGELLLLCLQCLVHGLNILQADARVFVLQKRLNNLRVTASHGSSQCLHKQFSVVGKMITLQ